MTRDDEIWVLASILRGRNATPDADAPFSAERYATEILETRDAENRGIEHVTLTALSQCVPSPLHLSPQP